MSRINAARLIADLRSLARFGQAGTGVDRTAFSPQDGEARLWLRRRMTEAGLEAQIDRIGNVVGRYPNVQRAVVIGSHTDTVPKGGWLDGAYGVICGLEIARSLRERGAAARLGVDVASFQDEEGTFLPFLGSRSFCGDLSDEELGAVKSKDGTRLTAALAEAGYGPVASRYEPARHAAYLEAHIEQGPRLEAEKRRIGVVTGIVGIRRLRISAKGQADHAGTTPMPMRKDAGATLVRLAGRVVAEFPAKAGAETVWNIGRIEFRPGAANVVPSEAEMVLEIRDTAVGKLDELEGCVAEWIAEGARQGPVSIASEPIARIMPTAMSPEIGGLIAAAAREHHAEPLTMPSGAGHDAMVLGRFMPAAMLFVPSIGGRSHDIVEDTSEADLALGCEVLAATVEKLAAAS
jgi:beta-ureidopropionase / N-carbamoyl-L-amino-acid hydrolase